MAKPGKPTYELFGPSAWGGDHARRGFRFQDRWIAFHLLEWIEDDSFRGVINEGVDDVEVSWFRDPARSEDPRGSGSALDGELFQLKDTVIGPKALDGILDTFRRKHRTFPGTWSRYHVVATRPIERLTGLRASLQKARTYLANHAPGSPVGRATIKQFSEQLKKLGVTVPASFLLDHVDLDFAVSWISSDDTFLKLFNGLLLGYGIPADRVNDAGQQLHALISGEKVGSLLARKTVTDLLDRFRSSTTPAERGSTIRNRVLPIKPLLEPRSASSRPTFVGLNVRPELSCHISVFQGDTVLLRLPDGTHGLLDCGVAAAPQIIPYLEERNVDTLDFVAISHWHADRHNGVIPVVSAMKRVRRLLVPPLAPNRYGERFLNQLRQNGHRDYRIDEFVRTNARMLVYESAPQGDGPRATVEALSPDMNNPKVIRLLRTDREFLSPNDSCTVFRLSVGGRRFLVTADATIFRWRSLFRELPNSADFLRADGLTLPRHGSRFALNRDVLRTIADPSGFYAVIDPLPRFGLPHRETLDLVRERKGEILICDNVPVHLVLTRDGLFEQRLPAGR